MKYQGNFVTMNFVDISLVLCFVLQHSVSSIKLNAIKFNSIDNSHSLQSSDVNIVSRPLHLTHFPLCSATSYMAAMLRDGGDLDSADRSMLDAESVHERMFRSV